ncbi:MAG: hypothetical protein GXY61_11745 [Lentisphaerae bacterium]|nr:hypothetical protein [Lentisphaerota bacterium]
MRIDSQRTPVLYRPLPAGFEAAKMAAYGCIARFQRALEAARMAAVRMYRPLPAGFEAAKMAAVHLCCRWIACPETDRFSDKLRED